MKEQNLLNTVVNKAHPITGEIFVHDLSPEEAD